MGVRGMQGFGSVDDEYDELAADAEAAPRGVGDNALRMVSQLGWELVAAQESLDRAAEELVRWKEQVRRLQEQMLPEAMHEVGLADFTLADGTGIELRPVIECHLAKERRERGCRWLEEHGHGGVVRGEVIVTVPKGGRYGVADVERVLAQAGFESRAEVTVHPQTLKKLYRELSERGEELPDDIFSTYKATKAMIKGTR
jgi:hypothetical protein